jgi:hypothetical protein
MTSFTTRARLAALCCSRQAVAHFAARGLGQVGIEVVAELAQRRVLRPRVPPEARHGHDHLAHGAGHLHGLRGPVSIAAAAATTGFLRHGSLPVGRRQVLKHVRGLHPLALDPSPRGEAGRGLGARGAASQPLKA